MEQIKEINKDALEVFYKVSIQTLKAFYFNLHKENLSRFDSADVTAILGMSITSILQGMMAMLPEEFRDVFFDKIIHDCKENKFVNIVEELQEFMKKMSH